MVLLTNCKAPVKTGQKDLLGKENLVAWCIVPFDSSERTPLQRAKMLVDLGITQYAYDYRDKHIPSFKEEIGVMKTILRSGYRGSIGPARARGSEGLSSNTDTRC